MSKMTRRELMQTLPLIVPIVGLSLRSLAAPVELNVNSAAPVERNAKHAHTSLGEIAYTEGGKGLPALFVHGAFLNGYQWRHVIERVADLRRTIAVDLMAHGATKIGVDQDVSFVAQAKMLEAFCEQLRLGQVDLVANDSGGAIAQIFAAHHPERIRTLTLTNCDTYDNWPGEVVQRLMKASEEQIAGVIRLWLKDVNSARAAFSPAYEHPEMVSEDTFRTYLEPLVQTSESIHNFKRFFDAADNRQTIAIEPLLKRLNAPTLIVWAMDDPVFNVKWAYWLRDTIPGARKVIQLDGARLFFPEERPDALAAALRDHWRDTGNR
jgi:pimeloyl-ACP methyl ester carboxylesterase